MLMLYETIHQDGDGMGNGEITGQKAVKDWDKKGQ